MEPIIRRYVQGFSANPTVAGQVLRQYSERDRPAFLKGAVPVLRQCSDTPGFRYLLTLLLTNDVVLEWLCDPALFSKDQAIQIAKQLSRVDPRVDTRLLDMAIGAPDDGNGTKITRMLDIIDETSDSMRVLGKLAQLSRHRNPKVRSKAVLLLGGQNRNPKWVHSFMSADDSRTRANAVESLWDVDTEGARAVLWQALGDESNRVVGNAVLGLYRLGDPSSIGLFLSLLNHGDPLFQRTGVWAIGQVEDVRFIPLLETLVSSGNADLHGLASQVLAVLNQKVATLSQQAAIRIFAHGLVTDDTGWTRLKVVALQRSRVLGSIKPTEFAPFRGSAIVEDYQVQRLGSSSEQIAVAFLIPYSIDPETNERLVGAAQSAMKVRRSGDQWAAMRYRTVKTVFEDAPVEEKRVARVLNLDLASPVLRSSDEDMFAPAIRFSGADASIEGMLLGKGAQETCAASLAAAIQAVSASRPKGSKCHIIVLLDERSAVRPASEGERLAGNAKSVLHVISRQQSEFGRSLATSSGGQYYESLPLDRLRDVIEGTCAAAAGMYEILFRSEPAADAGPVQLQVCTQEGIGKLDWAGNDIGGDRPS